MLLGMIRQDLWIYWPVSFYLFPISISKVSKQVVVDSNPLLLPEKQLIHSITVSVCHFSRCLGQSQNKTKILSSWSLYSTGEKQKISKLFVIVEDNKCQGKEREVGSKVSWGKVFFLYSNRVVGASLHKKVIFQQGLERDVRVSQTCIRKN